VASADAGATFYPTMQSGNLPPAGCKDFYSQCFASLTMVGMTVDLAVAVEESCK
jgi:hypothetical protein